MGLPIPEPRCSWEEGESEKVAAGDRKEKRSEAETVRGREAEERYPSGVPAGGCENPKPEVWVPRVSNSQTKWGSQGGCAWSLGRAHAWSGWTVLVSL